MSPRVIRWSVLVAAMSLVVTWLFARRYFPARQQALAVAFLGYTNINGGRATVFSVSNQCNVEVKRWAAVYLESAPFAKTNTPRQWTMDQTFDTPDRYLRPEGGGAIVHTGDAPQVGVEAESSLVNWHWGQDAAVLEATAMENVPRVLCSQRFGHPVKLLATACNG